MPEENSLGGLAKRWWKAKKTELLTGNQREREYAEAQAGNAQRDLGDKVASDLTFAAVPSLRRWKDNQDAAAARREADARAEILALPLFQLQLQVSGAVTGSASGPVHVRVEPPETDLDETDLDEADLDEADLDEGEQPELRVAIEVPEDGEGAPLVGGQPLLRLCFAIEGYHGPGSYDLGAQDDPDPLDYECDLGNRDEGYFWSPEIGPGQVTVGADERSFDVRLTMSGAAGEITLTAHLDAV
ncbi:hypothetical protein M6B22_08600 [Jatrophihabitans cynanchi]|jgi:hypothetical protein|uniref:Uncharacterized protein n=1 Tax=Jatrophihabitans cynanchi TaxID=2944128 RepID=A0ABY7K1U0_9ACTN|nr:hypothetical protein [Jatrophihabitans sp. SB3-54]WAX58810.1 hypothetical protein M6B22_08600 [Jatrophihabitans sp. SB3-54]